MNGTATNIMLNPPMAAHQDDAKKQASYLYRGLLRV